MLWRGELNLAATFWRYGVLTGIVLCSAFLLALHLTDSIFIGMVGFALVWAWQAFTSVAIWRSAGKYAGSSTWALLARAATLAGCLALGYGTALLLGIV